MPDRTILRGNPPTAIANDGTTVLKRYRVDAVIYARNIKEARRRLNFAVPMYLDDAMVKPSGRTGTQTEKGTSHDA